MRAYYNENNPYCVGWLKNLMSKGLIMSGDVDDRSIEVVQPSELIGYSRCHFFAGIAGWDYAMRLSKWNPGQEIWSGSTPCQPFSNAGAQQGLSDARHLWPHFFELIKARLPERLVGEQVAAAIGFGWIDGVFSDLESIGYSCGAWVVPACAVNAPHRRDRLWYVADRNGEGRERLESPAYTCELGQRNWRGEEDIKQIYCNPYGLAKWPKPIICKLDDGVPSRMDKLRAIGNCIDPYVASQIVNLLK